MTTTPEPVPARRAWRMAAAWCVVCAALAAIYWASDRPVTIRPGVPVNDKVAHFGAYAFLTVLWLTALRATWPDGRWSVLAGCAALCAAAYGATDEWHQSFVAGRTADVWDWVADAAGAATVALAVTGWATLRRRPAAAPPR